MLPDRPKLLVVDGHSLAYRAFHALPVEKFHSPQGIPVNAVYGLCSMIINLLIEYKPTHLAFCFDEGRDTFRKSIFPEYKANRSATPSEFKAQVSLIRGLVDAFGAKSFSDSNYEADDLIATLATKAAKQDFEVMIVTSDRDSFQLVNESVSILYPKKGISDLVRMDESEIFQKYGLTPIQYRDYAALRGDPSDNLPGIPGVGEKTAANWIQEFGSLENLINAKDGLTGKVGESFRNNFSTAETNLQLTKLVTDVALASDVSDLSWTSAQAQNAISFCTDLGFRSLLPRLKSLVGSTDDSDNRKAQQANLDIAVCLVNQNSVTTLVNGVVSELGYKTSGDLTRILLSVTKNGYCITNDLKSISKIHLRLGSRLDRNLASKLLDILILEYLVNPGSRPQLEDMFLVDNRDQLFQEESSDRDYCLAIARAFERICEKENYDLILELYRNLEAPVSLVLAEMEHNGIAIDVVKLKKMIEEKTLEQVNLEKSGYAEHGREFNFGSPKQLQEVLFNERGLTKTKKTKTGYTTDADALDLLMVRHPDDKLLQIIRDWRETSKIKQMLVSLLESVVSGRIHTTFMQTVAATGRLSSTKPNLQNVPIRTEAGRAIRTLFVPMKPYEKLITADYSQIELRVMAHLAQDKALIAAFESGEDLHVSVAAQIYGTSPEDVTPELRNQIKAVSYGLAYGLSSYGLSQSLRIDVSEADLLMAKFFERFAGVRDYLKEVVEEAKGNGYTETILGRRRYLPDLNHENRFRREVAERAALNAPIQGSAADIIKLAMVKVNETIYEEKFNARLLLQVHDELVIECTDEDLDMVTKRTQEVMQSVINLAVPLDVSVGHGDNWLTAAH